jgi:hypothetical protein
MSDDRSIGLHSESLTNGEVATSPEKSAEQCRKRDCERELFHELSTKDFNLHCFPLCSIGHKDSEGCLLR